MSSLDDDARTNSAATLVEASIDGGKDGTHPDSTSSALDDQTRKPRRLSDALRPAAAAPSAVQRLITPRSGGGGHLRLFSSRPSQTYAPEDLDPDVAPVDLPPAVADELAHEPFQVLARHLSGASAYSRGGQNPATIDPANPPDGGSEAWLVILGAWCVLFVQFGILTGFGQFESYYEAHQLSAYSKSTISWIGSLQTFMCFAGGLFSGRWFDAHGARLLIVGGTTTAVAALVALAFCKEYYQFLLAHMLFGIAGAALYSPCTAVVAHWFLRRRATAVGLILCGSGLGGVLFPIILSRLFPRLGFKRTVLIVAGMAAALFLPAWFTIKARLPPKESIPFRHAYKPWREGRYAIFVLGVALIWMNYFSPFFYANDFALSQGLPEHVATYSVGILNAGSFFGRGLSGPIAERFGVIRTFVTTGIISAIIVLGLWLPHGIGTGGTIVALFLYGFFSGFVIALVAACCAQLSPVREFGLRLGMMWTSAALPLLAGPQASGVLIAQQGGRYTTASIFWGITLLAGSLLTFAPLIVRDVRRKIAGGHEAGREGEEVEKGKDRQNKDHEHP